MAAGAFEMEHVQIWTHYKSQMISKTDFKDLTREKNHKN